jgi:hypothetical protein
MLKRVFVAMGMIALATISMMLINPFSIKLKLSKFFFYFKTNKKVVRANGKNPKV